MSTERIGMYKILIVEDDHVIADALTKHLASWDFTVEAVTEFKAILEHFISFQPQLVLLDIILPFFNGYHWCSEIRKHSKVPIIFLSSASDNMNIVMAVNMGGDDFIAKPFDLSVVTAKIQALIRRTYSFQNQVDILEHKGVILNLSDTTLHFSEHRIELTKNDFRIMKILMENSSKIVSRDDIMTRLWECDSFIDDNTLTVNITRLRKKLEDYGLKDYILTKKGIGYIIP